MHMHGDGNNAKSYNVDLHFDTKLTKLMFFSGMVSNYHEGACEDLFDDTLGALLEIENSLNLNEDETLDYQASNIEALAKASDRRDEVACTEMKHLMTRHLTLRLLRR